MRRMIASAGRVAFGAGVVLALGFGGQQAFASADTEEDCQPCYSQEECVTCCINELHAEDGYCVIATGACFCIY